jgi:mono/diheme cytochrome c family protein
VNLKINSIVFITALLFASCNFKQEQIHAALNIQHGFELYNLHCANCHQADGSGLARLIPPLKNSDWLLQNRQRLPQIIKYGIKEEIWVNGQSYTLPMPADTTLTNDEITKIANFVVVKFLGSENYFTPNETDSLLRIF